MKLPVMFVLKLIFLCGNGPGSVGWQNTNMYIKQERGLKHKEGLHQGKLVGFMLIPHGGEKLLRISSKGNQ